MTAPGAPRARGQAQKRIALDKLVNRKVDAVAEEATLDGVVEALTPWIAGAIQTLGQAAAQGDVLAAKTVLEFIKSANADKAGKHGTEMLERIARIRRGEPSGATTSED